MKSVLALDLSMTGTGLCSSAGTRTIKSSAKDSDEKRLDYISETILNEYNPDLVIMEGLAFSSNTGKATERAGLAWLVRIGFWRRHIPYVTIPPTTLKVFAIGSGRGEKDVIMLETAKRYPDLGIANNNEADAANLYAMALDHLGVPLVELPKTHRRAMDKIVWPEGFNNAT